MDDAPRVNAALGAATPLARPTPRWSADATRGLTEAEQLVYRSNLLGADLAVTNFGGGNTSAKVEETDPITGEPVTVLWVKGSGGDLGSIKADGFSRLKMPTLDALRPRFKGPADEDLMPGLYPYAAIEPGGRAPSDRYAAPRPVALRPRRSRAPGRADRAGRRQHRRSGGAGDLWRRGRLDAVAPAGLRAGAAAEGAGGRPAGPARRDHGRPRPHLVGRQR